jgi:ribonucleoside-diphosphate reductase alpha chain
MQVRHPIPERPKPAQKPEPGDANMAETTKTQTPIAATKAVETAPISRSGSSSTGTGTGLQCKRFFSRPDVSPYDEIQWEFRTASIVDSKGNSIFEQKDVEVPADWSMTATNIVASKYLHGQVGTPQLFPHS